MGVLNWSLAATRNALADPLIRAPDGAPARDFPGMIRGVMTGVRSLSDDQGGAITTGGTANAYTIETSAGVTELRAGLSLFVKIDRTNTDAATLNVDGTGPKPWRDVAGDEFAAGGLQPQRFARITWDADQGAWITDIFDGKVLADRIAVQESAQLPQRTSALEAAVENRNSLTFPTRAEAVAATIAPNVTTVLLRGRNSPGDEGGDSFKRVGAAPQHTAFFRSADGAYWEKISNTNTPEQFGAIAGDTSVDNYQALAEWFIYSRVTGELLTMPGRQYNTVREFVGVGGAKGPNVFVWAEAGAKVRGPMILDTGIKVYGNPITVNLLSSSDTTNYNYILDPNFVRPLVDKGLFITGGDLDRSRVALVDTAGTSMRVFTQAYPNTDTMNPLTPFYAADATIGIGVPGGPSFAIAAIPVRGASELRAVFDQGSFTRALYVRTSAGNYIFRADPGATSGTLSKKLFGQAATESTVGWNGPAFHQSYRPENVWWGLRNYDNRRFAILINGHEIVQVDTGAFIEEFGFGGLALVPTNIAIREWVLRTGMTEARGPLPPSFVLVGDSFTAPAHGGWPTHFRESLYGSLGIDVGAISNLAVSGQNSGDQLAVLKATGIGTQTHGIIMVGANDQQQGVDLNLYKDNLRQIIDYFLSRGKSAHMVVQTFFYGRDLAPGGFLTLNTAGGSPYRAAALRVAAEKGIGITDLTSSLKGMFADALTNGSEDPGLADNIHPTVLSRRLMGFEIARDVLSYWVPPLKRAAPPFSFPTDTFLGGWAPGGPWPGKLSLSDNGRVAMSGSIACGTGATKAAGTKIMQLPPNLRPVSEDLFRARGQFTAQVTLDITPDGSVYLATDLTSTGDTWISVAGISFDVQ